MDSLSQNKLYVDILECSFIRCSFFLSFMIYGKPASKPHVKDDGLEEVDIAETKDQIFAYDVESRMSPQDEIVINSELEDGNT